MSSSSKKIIIEDYSPQWNLQFEKLSSLFADRLGGLAISIEHVGSTAVPGLCAKPVIDIDIVVDTVSEVTNIIPLLVGLGYEYLGVVAIPDRFVFRPLSRTVPDDGSGRSWQKHHLYCYIKGSIALANHLILRDALRKDVSLANAYAALKNSLANSTNNMDEYVLGKTAFITKILGAHGMSHEQLSEIAEQNKSVIPTTSDEQILDNKH